MADSRASQDRYKKSSTSQTRSSAAQEGPVQLKGASVAGSGPWEVGEERLLQRQLTPGAAVGSGGRAALTDWTRTESRPLSSSIEPGSRVTLPLQLRSGPGVQSPAGTIVTDGGLEREADEQGARAARGEAARPGISASAAAPPGATPPDAGAASGPPTPRQAKAVRSPGTGPQTIPDTHAVQLKATPDKATALVARQAKGGQDNKTFVGTLSEDELNTLKFNPSGRLRFDPRSRQPNGAGPVTFGLWKAACDQLDANAPRKKGGEGTPESMSRVLEAKKDYTDASAEIKSLEKQHRETFVLMVQAPSGRREALNGRLVALEGQLNAAIDRAGTAYKTLTDEQKGKPALAEARAFFSSVAPFGQIKSIQKDISTSRTDINRIDQELERLRTARETLQKEQQLLANVRGSAANARRQAINKELKALYSASNAQGGHKTQALKRYTLALKRKAEVMTNFKNALKNATHFQTKGDLVAIGVKLWDASVWSSEVNDLDVAGGKLTGKTNVLATEGNARANLSVGKDGLTANAEVSAKATLVDMNYELAWPYEVDLFGESVKGKLFVFAEGMVGAQAKANIEANLSKKPMSQGSGLPKLSSSRALAGTGMQLDDAKGVAFGAGAFAGAKLTLGAGAGVEWNKKHHSAYKDKITKSSSLIVDALAAVNPPLGFVLRGMGARKGVEWLLQNLFAWGPPGPATLLSAVASVEGSAGAGAQISGGIGLKGGKFKYNFSANATWGLGLGGQVAVTLDVVEGPKFALIVLGELLPAATQWVSDQAQRGLNLVVDWFSADNKAYDQVMQKVHTISSAQVRAQMIDAMVGGWTTKQEQQAILEILRFSESKGDLSRVVSTQRKSEILGDMGGREYTEAQRLMASIGGTARRGAR